MMTISDLTVMVDLKQVEITATCACGQPVGGIVVKDHYDPVSARQFIAGAFRGHLKAYGAWHHPQGHALMLDVKPLVTVK